MGTHYSYFQDPRHLRLTAKKIALVVYNELRKQGNVSPVLVYRGMSGIAGATALSLALAELGMYIHMAYVRKPSEQSHGSSVEHSFAHDVWTSDTGIKYMPVFVDDFVATGATIEASIRALSNLGGHGIFDGDIPLMVVEFGSSDWMSSPRITTGILPRAMRVSGTWWNWFKSRGYNNVPIV